MESIKKSQQELAAGSGRERVFQMRLLMDRPRPAGDWKAIKGSIELFSSTTD